MTEGINAHLTHQLYVFANEDVAKKLGFRQLCCWCGAQDSGGVVATRKLVVPCAVRQDHQLRRSHVTVAHANPAHTWVVNVAWDSPKSGERESGIFRMAFRKDGVKFGHLSGKFSEMTGSFASTLVAYTRAWIAASDPDLYVEHVQNAGETIYSLLAHQPDDVPDTGARVIVKVGLAVCRDGRLLLVRKRDSSVWILPGGKPERVETDMMALRRELQEELQVRPVVADSDYLGVFEDEIADKPGWRVNVLLYKGEVDGEPVPSSEIDATMWWDGLLMPRLPQVIAPSIRNQIVPRLIALGLLGAPYVDVDDHPAVSGDADAAAGEDVDAADGPAEADVGDQPG